MISALRDERSPDDLLRSIFLDIVFHLNSAMNELGISIPWGSHQLISELQERFIRVTHRPGIREINVCDDSNVFRTRTKPVASGYIWQSKGRYAGETLATNINGSADGTERMAHWLTFSDSYWHIMVLEWLSRHLEGWLERAGITDPETHARRLAKRATQDIPDATPLILAVLTDAAGLPRNLLAYVLTRELRADPSIPFWLQEGLTAHWAIRHHWPGRSARLLALVVYAREKNGSGSICPHDVRDSFIRSGLTRGAWAHLQRLPSSLITQLAVLLEAIEVPSYRRAFLEELSHWLSRLGKDHLYYRIERRHLVAALVWLPYEASCLREQSAEQRVTSEIFSRDLSVASVIIHRRGFDAAQYLKVRHVLFSLSENILLEDALSLPDIISEFANVLDWLADEVDRLPVHWFKQAYCGFQRRSERWHHAQIERQRLVAQQLQAQQQANEAARRAGEIEWEANITEKSWSSPITEFEHSGLKLVCLLNHEQLQLEGWKMDHCVGSYTKECFTGISLIFSVIHNGAHIGTLEMHKDKSGQWKPLQFKGRRNKNLMKMIRPQGALHKAFEHFSMALNHQSKTG